MIEGMAPALVLKRAESLKALPTPYPMASMEFGCRNGRILLPWYHATIPVVLRTIDGLLSKFAYINIILGVGCNISEQFLLNQLRRVIRFFFGFLRGLTPFPF